MSDIKRYNRYKDKQIIYTESGAYMSRKTIFFQAETLEELDEKIEKYFKKHLNNDNNFIIDNKEYKPQKIENRIQTVTTSEHKNIYISFLNYDLCNPDWIPPQWQNKTKVQHFEL